jgi:hypothetical protein
MYAAVIDFSFLWDFQQSLHTRNMGMLQLHRELVAASLDGKYQRVSPFLPKLAPTSAATHLS